MKIEIYRGNDLTFDTRDAAVAHFKNRVSTDKNLNIKERVCVGDIVNSSRKINTEKAVGSKNISAPNTGFDKSDIFSAVVLMVVLFAIIFSIFLKITKNQKNKIVNFALAGVLVLSGVFGFGGKVNADSKECGVYDVVYAKFIKNTIKPVDPKKDDNVKYTYDFFIIRNVHDGGYNFELLKEKFVDVVAEDYREFYENEIRSMQENGQDTSSTTLESWIRNSMVLFEIDVEGNLREIIIPTRYDDISKDFDEFTKGAKREKINDSKYIIYFSDGERVEFEIILH